MELTDMQKQLKFLCEDMNVNMTAIPKKTIEHLISLKNKGFNPKVIYDIGSCVCHWYNVAKLIFPEADIYLFEGNEDVEMIYKNKGIPKKNYNIGLLSNEDGKEVNYYYSAKHPGGNSIYQEIGSQNGLEDFKNFKVMKTQKLSTICKNKNIPLPDLIKIDVQGSEKDIIKGAEEIIKHCTYLIVEMQHMEYNKGAPRVNATKPYIEKLGFKCTHERIVGGYFDDDYCFKNKHK
jgi:FkbM family methyltransferase